jgi:site-specific recombinase XerD
LRWLDSNQVSCLNDLTPLIIRRWLAEYQKTHAPASVRTVFISIRAFIRWAQRETLLASDPLLNIHAPKVDIPVKTALTAGQIRGMIAALSANTSPLGVRNSAIMCVLLDTGVRASELCAMRLDDLQGDSMILRRTKSGKPRVAFLGKRSSQAVHRYLVQGRPRLHPSTDNVFLSDRGGPMTRNGIRCLMERLSEHVGFHVNAHGLRHTWATNMARSGTSAITLQSLAGWTESDLAQRYVHLAAEELRAAHAKAAPLDSAL